MIGRRAFLATGGAALLTSAAGTLQYVARPRPARPEAGSRAALDRAQAALAMLADHFFDEGSNSIRPFNGGSAPARTGLVDTAIATPAFWMMECFANVLFNDWKIAGSERSRRRLAGNWKATRERAGWTELRLAGYDPNGSDYTVARTFDDGVWLATNLMHVHMATEDPLALACMAEAVANTCAKFADPDTVHNPPITYVPATPNIRELDYGLANHTDAAGRVRRTGPAFVASTYGSLYCRTDDADNYRNYGKVGSVFEAGMGLCALYVHEQLGHAGYLRYAEHAFAVCKARAKTADPGMSPYPRADGVGSQPPSDPSLRKAYGIYETQWCLNAAGGTGADPDAPFLAADQGFYGKPVRNLDSTYLGGALMQAVLGARLGRALRDDAYLDEAVDIARAIISPQAYGRMVDGRTLIQNTRDPHSEGHWAVPFAMEVLTLPGVPEASVRAFVDTASHILSHCVTPDGFITADWAGPELNPFGDGGRGTMTWDQDHDRLPGSLGGHATVMVSSESLAMAQAGAWLQSARPDL